MWTTNPFVGTWRDAAPSCASDDFTMFISRTSSNYKATLYITHRAGGSSVVHVPLIRTGDDLNSYGPGRNTLSIVRRKGGRIGVDGYGAPAEMVRTSRATNPVFE